MILKKLSLFDLHKSIKEQIEKSTDLLCLDDIPINQPAPFTFLEFVNSQPRNTKTMFVHEYTIHVHVISSSDNSSIKHYDNIKKVEEALTKNITLPEGYVLWGQTESGLVANYKEPETNERHAVLAFVFQVSYGLKIKH